MSVFKKHSFFFYQRGTFCKFLKVADEVKLGFKYDYPMKFDYITETEDLQLAFYLAPKIKDDA